MLAGFLGTAIEVMAGLLADPFRPVQAQQLLSSMGVGKEEEKKKRPYYLSQFLADDEPPTPALLRKPPPQDDDEEDDFWG